MSESASNVIKIDDYINRKEDEGYDQALKELDIRLKIDFLKHIGKLVRDHELLTDSEKQILYTSLNHLYLANKQNQAKSSGVDA